MGLSAPNFAGIRLAPQFQDVSLELKSAILYRFALPFKYPLKLNNLELHQREGLILVLTDTSGHVGFGEISPLIGFSRETMETAIYKTTGLVDRMLNFGALAAHEHSEININWKKRTAPSVVHFGVETALLSLLANARNVSLGVMLYGRSSTKIPINGLIRSSISEWVPEADSLVSQGYRTLKIKVGRINAVLEARGIKDIRASVGPDIKLRLDANRSWDLETAVNFGLSVKDLEIEYIEEPTIHPAELPRFYDACAVPFAFDETLHRILDPTLSFEAYTGLKALVLKPTLIGCSARFVALVNQAREQNIMPVLSSSYESDVGLAALAHLAAAITGEQIAVGLDTRSALSAGTSKTPSLIQNGWMPVKTLGTSDLDLSHCELIYHS
ncbi:MAG: o-succinylbenzoate synthase [Candidatus Marinimicrobia bacterium]|nr:o-succinylbenzoate synthase [Candidatus Neomarinimicrobiota bacterium]